MALFGMMTTAGSAEEGLRLGSPDAWATAFTLCMAHVESLVKLDQGFKLSHIRDALQTYEGFTQLPKLRTCFESVGSGFDQALSERMGGAGNMQSAGFTECKGVLRKLFQAASQPNATQYALDQVAQMKQAPSQSPMEYFTHYQPLIATAAAQGWPSADLWQKFLAGLDPSYGGEHMARFLETPRERVSADWVKTRIELAELRYNNTRHARGLASLATGSGLGGRSAGALSAMEVLTTLAQQLQLGGLQRPLQPTSPPPAAVAAANVTSATAAPTTPRPIFTDIAAAPRLPNTDPYHIDHADYELGLPTSVQIQGRPQGFDFYCRLHGFNTGHATSSCMGAKRRDPGRGRHWQPLAPAGCGGTLPGCPAAFVLPASPAPAPLHAPHTVLQHSAAPRQPPTATYHAVPPPRLGGGGRPPAGAQPLGSCDLFWDSGHVTAACSVPEWERHMLREYNVRREAHRPPALQRAAASSEPQPLPLMAAATIATSAAASGGIRSTSAPHPAWRGNLESFTVDTDSYFRAEYGEGFMGSHVTSDMGMQGAPARVTGRVDVPASPQAIGAGARGQVQGAAPDAGPDAEGVGAGSGRVRNYPEEAGCNGYGEGSVHTAPTAAASDIREPVPVSFRPAQISQRKQPPAFVRRTAPPKPPREVDPGSGGDERWQVEIVLRRPNVCEQELRAILWGLGSSSPTPASSALVTQASVDSSQTLPAPVTAESNASAAAVGPQALAAVCTVSKARTEGGASWDSTPMTPGGGVVARPASPCTALCRSAAFAADAGNGAPISVPDVLPTANLHSAPVPAAALATASAPALPYTTALASAAMLAGDPTPLVGGAAGPAAGHDPAASIPGVSRKRALGLASGKEDDALGSLSMCWGLVFVQLLHTFLGWGPPNMSPRLAPACGPCLTRGLPWLRRRIWDPGPMLPSASA